MSAIMERKAEGIYEIKFPEGTGIEFPEGTKVANLEQAGVLGGFAKTEIMGIPIGGAVIGVAMSSLIDALVARFGGQAAFLSGTMGKLILAWVTKQWGSRWLGKDVANAAAFVFTIDAVSGWVEQLMGNLLGAFSAKQTTPGQRGGVLDQAQKVAGDYYATKFAGR